MKISVVIVEDDLRFQEGLYALLNETSFVKIIGKYNNAKDGIEAIIDNEPDIALIDLGLPDISGLEIIRRVKEKNISTEFLVLTVFDDDKHLFSALSAGAVGYIVKDEISLDGVAKALKEVIDGGAPMSRSIAKKVLSEFIGQKAKPKNKDLQSLTKRELEILKNLSNGFTTKKISEMLFISYETVRSHQKNIYKKLHVNSIVEAIAVYKTK